MQVDFGQYTDRSLIEKLQSKNGIRIECSPYEGRSFADDPAKTSANDSFDDDSLNDEAPPDEATEHNISLLSTEKRYTIQRTLNMHSKIALPSPI